MQEYLTEQSVIYKEYLTNINCNIRRFNNTKKIYKEYLSLQIATYKINTYQ